MRKTLFIALIAAAALIVPAAAFAQVGIGLAAFSDTPILAASDVNRDLLDGTFSFGANGRIRFNSLTLDALGLYASGEESVDLYLTGQLSMKLFLFRISGGVGPAIRMPLADPFGSMAIDWINGKVDVDLELGRISVGLSFQYLIPSSDVNAIDFSLARGRIGGTVLIW